MNDRPWHATIREGRPRAAMHGLEKLTRDPYLRELAARAGRRVRRSRLLDEDIVPYDIHRFDRDAWVLKELLPGVRLWCSLDDRAICRPILLNCYERPETKFVQSLLKPGDHAVDAGANIGYFSLIIARLVGESGTVEAFEPLPYLADALEASVAENSFDGIVRIHRLALAGEAGRLRMRHAPRTANFGGAHFLDESAPAPPAWEADEYVSASRLDDVLGGRDCAFIKMDVEGAEPRLVAGAIKTLEERRPVVLGEIHNRQLALVSRSSGSELIRQLAASGYGCRTLDADGRRGPQLPDYAAERPINVVFDPLEADDRRYGNR